MILKEYLKHRKGSPDDYLFCTQYGGQLTRNGLFQAVKKYNHSRGVLKTSIHLFRHTFARECIVDDKMAIEDLQHALGHSCIEMSKEYVAMYDTDLHDIFIKRDPLAKFNRGKTIKIRES